MFPLLTLFFFAFLPDDFFYLNSQGRYFIFYNIPNNVVINTKIIVNQPIPHSGHSAPFNLVIALAKIWPYLL
tara:strand:- start:197 stop:412 length:216 start_codon:yes stop_codon:yes gene_type:complete